MFSQRIPSGDQVVEELQVNPAIRDVLRAYPDAHSNHLNNKANGRPIPRAPPARILRYLNQTLWHTVDHEANQVADQTRWMWGKEAYDSTKFEYVGVGRPLHSRMPLLRSAAWNHYLPATKEDS